MTTVNGTIDAEIGGDHEVSAKSVNGRIRAKFVSGFTGARLKTVNGGVEAILPESASFTCNLSQVNGDFEASFPLSIHSHPGNRRVSGEVNGGRYQLQITTVNGDVAVQHLPPPPAPPARRIRKMRVRSSLRPLTTNAPPETQSSATALITAVATSRSMA